MKCDGSLLIVTEETAAELAVVRFAGELKTKAVLSFHDHNGFAQEWSNCKPSLRKKTRTRKV